SPSCLALADHEMAPHLARLLREAGQAVPESKPTLEINPQHALLQRIEGEQDEAKAADLALLLLEQAEVAAGAPLPDPAAFVQRAHRLLLGCNPQARRFQAVGLQRNDSSGPAIARARFFDGGSTCPNRGWAGRSASPPDARCFHRRERRVGTTLSPTTEPAWTTTTRSSTPSTT